jgi:hypothetical protein
MTDLGIELDQRVLPPGGTLRGVVQLDPASGDERRRVELSVLWETSGKGDVDTAAVALRVLSDGNPATARGERRFEIPLPLLPWSYRGELLRIFWYVRVRRIHPTDDDTWVDAEFEITSPMNP